MQLLHWQTCDQSGRLHENKASGHFVWADNQSNEGKIFIAFLVSHTFVFERASQKCGDMCWGCCCRRMSLQCSLTLFISRLLALSSAAPPKQAVGLIGGLPLGGGSGLQGLIGFAIYKFAAMPRLLWEQPPNKQCQVSQHLKHFSRGPIYKYTALLFYVSQTHTSGWAFPRKQQRGDTGLPRKYQTKDALVLLPPNPVGQLEPITWCDVTRTAIEQVPDLIVKRLFLLNASFTPFFGTLDCYALFSSAGVFCWSAVVVTADLPRWFRW